MENNIIVCKCNNIDYITIRKAMVMGARKIDEIMDMTGASTICRGCAGEIEKILDSVCGCNNVSLKAVVDAVKSGVNTPEGIEKITGAGAECGKCKVLVENIIKIKR